MTAPPTVVTPLNAINTNAPTSKLAAAKPATLMTTAITTLAKSQLATLAFAPSTMSAIANFAQPRATASPALAKPQAAAAALAATPLKVAAKFALPAQRAPQPPTFATKVPAPTTNVPTRKRTVAAAKNIRAQPA